MATKNLGQIKGLIIKQLGSLTKLWEICQTFGMNNFPKQLRCGFNFREVGWKSNLLSYQTQTFFQNRIFAFINIGF
jgi:hypothetical protein